MTVQHGETGELMEANDKDIAFITGEGMGEPLGVLPSGLQQEAINITRQGDIPISHYEFDEMAADLEGQLHTKIPLVDIRVARFEETCIDGRLDVFSVTGRVTINENLFIIAVGVPIDLWRGCQEHALGSLAYKIAGGIANSIVEWRPKETL